jgi:hypothetical protein
MLDGWSMKRLGAPAVRLMWVVLPLLGVGCVTHAGGQIGYVYEHPVVAPEYVPERIEYYPRVRYRGEYTYLVDGRWYYPSRTPRGWVVFKEEPEELRRYRIEGRFDRHPAYPSHERYPRGEPGYGTPRERHRGPYHYPR